MDNKFDIYETIATRTNGDIYLGVVGPVRTGKSTFITKFVNELVVPFVANKNDKKRTVDELPQSANGKTIMTMQPRFIPNEAATIQLSNSITANVRLVDCVGYLIDGATGATEDGKSRLVKTPWFEQDIPFERAAEIGTSKVIKEHSTIGIVVTTDGSFGEIPRVNYVPAEERVVNELREIKKPFVVVLNTLKPKEKATMELAESLEKKYSVPVLPINVLEMTEKDVLKIMESVLYEFPIKKINIKTPEWIRSLPFENKIIGDILNEVSSIKPVKMSDFRQYQKLFASNDDIETPKVTSIKLASGEIDVQLSATRKLFFKVLSEMCEEDIQNDVAMMNFAKQLAVAKREYARLKDALESVNERGYGVVIPGKADMALGDPEIIKHGQNNGVKLRAKASSLHIMKVDVETEVVPAVSGAEMGSEFVSNMLSNYEDNPGELWNTNMFGKSLTDLAHDGIISKITTFPEEAQIKMRKTLSKITNEGKGGIICILL